MICEKEGHVGGESCSTCREHDFLKGLAQKRNERWGRNKKISFMARESQVTAFSELWESWVERWGKYDSVDHLIRMMATVESKVRDRESVELKPANARALGKVQFVKTSAPRLKD